MRRKKLKPDNVDMIKEGISLSEDLKKSLLDNKEWPLTSCIHSRQKRNQPLGLHKVVQSLVVSPLYLQFLNSLSRQTKERLVFIAE